jgi:hypothetical protein
MQARAAGCLNQFNHSETELVVGLTTARFKLLILPMRGFLSNTRTVGLAWFRITSACVLHNLVV